MPLPINDYRVIVILVLSLTVSEIWPLTA